MSTASDPTFATIAHDYIDDGQCVIDVIPRQDHSSDLASFLEIKNAAEIVIEKCIDSLSSPAQGGFVGNVGM